MDRLRAAELELQMRHRHGDEWVPMRREHDPANLDIERQLGRGTIYRCERCEEYIQVEPVAEDELER